MSVITDALNSSSSVSSAASTGSPASASDIENSFLTLLVTQLQNQDPLNPMDNSQLTTQLAQISTVSGIQQLNTTMNSLSSSFMAGQSVQAASMIGHTVLAAGSTLALTNGSATGAVNLAGAADNVTVTINGAAGNVVRTISLGAQAPGMVGFSWDGTTDNGGTAPDGSYRFQVQASSGGTQVGATTLAIGQVNSVNVGAQGLSVSVGGVGNVNLTDVKQIF
ncbi:MAG TPA: flagellar hook assembly protein FlgD [Burkholderiales bacterium]|nr:flagellar hook assembly protein FlgD [Burkholderiales bacterium]